MHKRIGRLAIQAWLVYGTVFGQVIVSSIVGRVGDSSGASIPGAQITVTNTQTGISVRVAADNDGTYSVPGLLAGPYDVTIEKPGFQLYKATRILESSETARVDAMLAVAGAQQAVSVVERAPMLRTDSMSIVTSVTSEQLADLPTNLQTVDAFITLAPGAQAYGDATNPPIGGGTHWGSVNFTLNGAEVNDPGNSGAVTIQGTGLLVLPPPSSLQELSVQSNGMTAQYRGKSTVTLVTKGGTNQYHGEAYEYLKNTLLNASSFALNTAGQPRSINHLNQFGGNLGGPLKRDKAFFFFDYGSYRRENSTPVQLRLPSAAMRNGDFSALCTAQGGAFTAAGICSNGNNQLYNPFTGQAFPNNQIPASLITSQSKALLAYLPLPTVGNSPGLPNGPFNYITAVGTYSEVNSVDLRTDYNWSNKDRLFGVYSQRIADPWGVEASYPQDYGQREDGYKEHTVTVSETHNFGPATINELRGTWGEYATKFNGQNTNFDPTSLWPQDPETLYHGLPTITATGYTGLWYDYGTGLYTPRRDVEFADDFTRVKGRHTIQAGVDETGYKMWNRVPSSSNTTLTGAFGFTGAWTGNRGWPGLSHSNGNSFADFLLGVANSSSTSAQGAYADWLYTRYWGIYAQDTWQASPRLTIIYGLRYEYQTPWHYRTQELTTFDFSNGKLVLPENSATPTLPPGARADMFAAYPFETTQSAGLPLDFDQGDKNNFAPRVGFAFRPFNNEQMVIRGGYGVYYNFQPGLIGSGREAFNPPWPLANSAAYTSNRPGNPTSPYLPDITFSNPFPGVGSSTVSPNPTIDYFQHDFKNAVAQEWNFTVERQVEANWAIRASYVGSQTHHLPYNAANINQPLVQEPNVTIQKQRPYQPWGAIDGYLSGGKQNFNQIQLGLEKRFAAGQSFQAKYQYTRSLDDVDNSGGWNDPNDANLDYGNSVGLRRHWLVFNYIYELPFGRGRLLLRNAPGWVNALAGGWQVSGISTYGTGQPFSVDFGQGGTGIVGWSGTRADVVPGVPLYGGQQSGHDITDGVQWFNPAAFAPPTKWTWGDSARDMLFGPGLYQWNVSAMKSFALRERVRLRFRSDFINAFNHLNLGNPDSTIPDTRDGGTPNPNAGKITAGSGSNRTIQVSMKLSF